MQRAQDRVLELRAEARSASPRLEEDPRGKMLRDVVAALRSAGHELLILHGYDDFPHHVSSDVDAVSPDPMQIPRILSERCMDDPITTVQVIQHETSAFYCILYRSHAGKPTFLALDVSSDYRRDGRVFFEGQELLEDPRPVEFFDVPSPEIEFAYYLVKKVAKGSLNEAQARRLSRLYSEDPAGCDRQLARFFPREEAEIISGAAWRGIWEPVRARIRDLRRIMLDKLRREQPVRVLRYWLGAFGRLLRRILRPTGLMVVFLGVDGSGKSSVIDRVERSLAPAFRRTAQYRLRPSRRKGGGVPVTDPHALSPRGRVSSLVKLAFWLADYTAGYAVRTFPRLVRSTLVLFDRYYQDLLVDSRRYRYGGPMWLARLVGRILPRPDLIVVLDAPPEVLRARKQEISPEEVARQREEYLRLADSLPNGHVVDASNPLDRVVADVEKIVLDHMAARTARRLKFGGRR